MGRGTNRATMIALALAGMLVHAREARAGDDEDEGDAEETFPSPAPQPLVESAPIVVAAPVPTQVLATMRITVAVTAPTPTPIVVDYSLRIRPAPLPWAPPRPLAIRVDEDPVLMVLRRPAAPPVFGPQPTRTGMLAAGIATLSAGYFLSTIPLIAHWRDPMLAVPVLGPFVQSAIWDANASTWADRVCVQFGMAFEIFTGFVQLGGLALTIAGVRRAERSRNEGRNARPTIALLPGASGTGTGATLVGTF